MTALAQHVHPDPVWPVASDDWEQLGGCCDCGLTMFRLFIRSATWVIRRVEKVAFLDDRTVRRQVSVDYVTPSDCITLRHGDGEVRVIPLTMMRRKSLVNFDLRDSEDARLPLLGLREAQALTMAITRAWARQALVANGRPPEELALVDDLLRRLVAGDQTEMNEAFRELEQSPGDTPQGKLARDEPFRGLVDRLSGSFILFTTDDAPAGTRRIVKFSYDEPLTLRFSQPGGGQGGLGVALRRAGRR